MEDTGANDIVTRETYPFSDKSKADRDLTKIQVEQSKKQNVLNSYRSIAYHFTFAGLLNEYLTDPTLYRNSELDLIILKSGGKGNSKLTISETTKLADTAATVISAETANAARNKFAARDPRRVDIDNSDQPDEKMTDYGFESAKESVKGFNANSPGRFDMFIENIEIDTLMAFTADGGTTLPSQIKFDVIEPYSVNGFIEAYIL